MAQRTRGGRLAVLALAATFVLGPVGLAGASPTDGPSSGADRDADRRVTDQDVRDARRALATGASAVAQAEVELAELSLLRETAWVAAQVAAEDYTSALVALTEAEEEARRTAAQLALAEERLEAARRELGALAQHAYRSGGSLDTVHALLSADGLEDVLARADVLALQSQRSDAVVQRFQAAEVVATTLQERARRAQEARQAASQEAEQRHSAALRAQADAERQVEQAALRRDELIVELAALRSTSVEVERARQEQLDADREARAQAQAAAERARQTAPSPPPRPGASPAPTPSPSPTEPAGPTPPPVTPPPSTPTPSPTTPPPTPPSSGPGLGHGVSRGSAAQGEAAVAWALAQVGKPYLLGATGPDRFDCSGLTSQAWIAQGVNPTRTSRSQYVRVLKISYADLRPGDLVFWGTDKDDPESIYHVAMYIGGGQIVEALNPSTGVVVRNLASRAPAAQMPFAGRP